MTRVLITGAAGFLGRKLTRSLLESGQLRGLSEGEEALTELVLVDRIEVQSHASSSPLVATMRGDLADPTFVRALAERPFASIFHLAANLTLDAERDPDASYATSVEALRTLLASGQGGVPRVVFASSIAVFGGVLPETVDDTVRSSPTTTYGTHKAMVELLLADLSRRGQVDGRSLRLPIVLTRPGAPTPTISDRIAAVIREPLQGRHVTCPLDPETMIPVASAGAVATALIALHDAPDAALPANRAMNLPALSITIADMAAAVTGRQNRQPVGDISFSRDDQMQRIVDGWPRRFVSEAATRLGLYSDSDFHAIISDHLSDIHGDERAQV